MNQTWPFIRGLLLLVAMVVIAGFFVFLGLRRSDDPRKILWKSLLTAPILFVAFMSVKWLGPFGPFVIALCGILLSVIWTPHIGEVLTRPLTGLFDGGNVEPERRPLYSIAQALRKRGRYDDAVNEVRRQLLNFPDDFEGQMMVAEIQAENLNDLPGAENTLRRLCDQDGHPPGQIGLAFNTLADWHLKYHQDREAAKAALEEIIARLPESEFTLLAKQRIAHLGETGFLVESHEPRRIRMKHGIDDVGLRSHDEQPKAPEVDPEKQAQQYVEHLATHPDDAEAREKLAVLYAGHYGRLDLATLQLEELISNLAHPPRRIAHWLNLLADLQVQHAAGYEAVRHTLQRIVNLAPDAAAAQNARNRIDLLKLELKKKETSQPVKIGSYEQDIGLKPRSPRQL